MNERRNLRAARIGSVVIIESTLAIKIPNATVAVKHVVLRL